MDYDDLVGRLTSFADIEDGGGACDLQFQTSPSREAATAISHLSALVRELKLALRPFGDACTITNKDDDEIIDDSIASTKITFGHLRAARQALGE